MPAPSETATLRVLDGCPCVPLHSEQQAIDIIDRFISLRQGGYSVAINAEKILLYGSRADVRAIIDGAALPYPDGAGAVISLKWLHGRAARKLDMPIACLEGARRHGWRIFVLGATEEVNRRAVEAIRRRYPEVRIVGRLNGYEADEVKLQSIEGAQPDLVMAALGSPRQEILAAEIVRRMPQVFVIGCGGALDILAGRTRRAPGFMVNNGLEWLYRLLREPSRWRRQIVLPRFLLRVGMAALQARPGPH